MIEPSDSTPEQPDELPSHYTPTPLFQFTALLLAAASVWLAINVWQNPNVISMIVFVGVFVITVGMVFSAFARASYDDETLTYYVPLRPKLIIQRSQIVQVSLEGRRTRALVIGFHPRAEDGRIESERIQYVNLVPLQDQWELLERLEGTGE
jgi:hypothetical protein